jgi:hypothetical protein
MTAGDPTRLVNTEISQKKFSRRDEGMADSSATQPTRRTAR